MGFIKKIFFIGVCVRVCTRAYLCLTLRARFLCLWDLTGKNTGVDCHFLLQGIFQTRGIKHLSPESAALPGGFFTTSATWSHFKMLFPAVLGTSLVAQTVKRLSTMRETRVRSLAWEAPLEKEMTIHSRTIARKIPWTEEPGGL